MENTLNTQNIRNILERIWSGELPHDQGEFESSCSHETARCLAGWDCFFRNVHTNFWQNSREYNGLSQLEAKLLFSMYTNKHLQRLVLEALESGKRIDINRFERTNIYSYGYNDSNWTIQTDVFGSYRKIIDFLGEEVKSKVSYRA